MTIERVYSPGWGVGDKLTSAQQNALDINVTAALDKRAGRGDVFASVLVATGPGRTIKTVQTGPDASTTFHVQNGNSIVRVPTLTAARTYTLGASGATGGDRMSFYVEGTGSSPSGYAIINHASGPEMFRLGATNTNAPNVQAEGDSAEFIFTDGTWKLMYGAGPGMRHVEFTSSTTWTCPPGVYEILLIGYGGGGGGGTGATASEVPAVYSSFNFLMCGGAGGGGAQLRIKRMSVTPGRTYTITVGGGGLPDGDGQDTTIADSAVPSAILETFVGAQRGVRGTVGSCIQGGMATCATGYPACIAPGGAGTRIFYVTTGVSATPSGPLSVPTGNVIGVPTMLRVQFGSDLFPLRGPLGMGAGGPGVAHNFPPAYPRNGYYSVEGYAGGTGGQHGANQPTQDNGWGGGGGGGGGGGPAGIGGAGGTGGDCSVAGAAGKAGVAGQAGQPNTGAGGGGGGASARETGVPLGGGAGGAGATGGSGKLGVVFFK